MDIVWHEIEISVEIEQDYHGQICVHMDVNGAPQLTARERDYLGPRLQEALASLMAEAWVL